MNTEALPMSDEQMFEIILAAIQRNENRLDEMKTDHFSSMQCVQKQLGEIRADLVGHKVKISAITAGIALAVSTAVAWLMGQIGR